ncbi:tRNA lysidine(34) synthetase TilS [Rhizobium halophilum]|uniref:tRNA lysidine(34) synthetase TilS n=1 Tax=Rhizobium halophilum TaxID=2846852 RepID=UPI001EFC7C8A|nr:tRNA lysidine(34) synthetase TilS [Rhizobium halophilum]MCF6367710.1 tRNA lysidine(34) synthetase TilS [Rhizobium halophilum]
MIACTRPFLSINEAIDNFLQQAPRPLRLLVAVSGGSDSLGLLHALAEHASDKVTLVAATVDHRLRSEAAEEAAFVAALCQRLHIPHRTMVWQGEKPSTGISAAAREARYGLLCQAADEADADFIVTGHTVDDQWETVAMRAARGAGSDRPGLAGMADLVLLYRRFWLVRPLLQTRRATIRDFLRSRGQDWIDDPSNADTHYERARMRMTPVSPAAEPPAQIGLAGERRRSLSEAAATLLAEHAVVQHAALMRLPLSALRGDMSVLRYALSVCAAVLGGRAQGPGTSSMERVLKAIGEGARGRITAGRVIFDFRRDALYLCRETRDLPDVTVPPQTALGWDGRFVITNRGPGTVTVGSASVNRERAQELFPRAPASVAMRAARALPEARGADHTIMIAPILSPFDRFLPCFDLRLASTLGQLFGCERFPTPTWVGLEWKR